MIRRIISIDREQCNGCGLCAKACHEGAIGMVNGKAQLLRDDYCDGLGDCLPACPVNAITFVEREALAYDEAAVLAAKEKTESSCSSCSGTKSHSIAPGYGESSCAPVSRLVNFPVQIKLSPVQAPWFDDADLLIAADCTAYAYGDFHREFMKDRITLIGCPKLDGVNYAEKLGAILASNNIRSITITRMTVPCCGGLPFAVQNALTISGKDIPVQTAVIAPDGRILRG